MSGKVVNLRQARKARARAQKRVEADANAARHGEGGTERSLREAEAARKTARLDQHRLDDGNEKNE